MKKVFLLSMIIGFFLGSYTYAWQDPCSIIENAYICEGFTLDDWVEIDSLFSPTPECVGTVILWAPDGTGNRLDYAGNLGIITIAGIPCRINNRGNLECKIVTQPEVSTILTFGVQE